MVWQFSVYVLPLLTTVCGSLLLGVIAWWHREYRYARSLVVLMLAVTWWSLAYAVGLSVTSPGLKRLAYSLAYPAVGVVSITWFVFAIQYTGRLRVPTRRELAALTVIPVLTGVAPIAGQSRDLVWPSIDVVSRGGLELMTNTHGPLFWLHTAQAYTLVGSGTVLILAVAVLSDDVYRSQAVSLVFAAVFPLFTNLLYFVGWTGPADLTPAAFSLSGAVLIGSVFRDQLLRSLPLARELARDKLIEQMASAVLVVDKRGRVVDCNPAAESLAAARSAGTVGSQIETAFPAIAEALDSQDGSSSPTELATTDGGTEKYYEIDTMPLQRGHGTVTGQLLVVHDVTERRRNERELERERHFIEQALNTLNDVFYVINPDGSFRRWNDSLNDVTGRSDDELAQSVAQDVFPDEEQTTVSEAIETVVRTGGTTVEANLLTADGECLPYEFTGARLTDGEGTLMGLVGVGRDISERKQREHELRTFQEAVEEGGRMIYWMSRDGTVEYANPALAAQVGTDAAAMVDEEKTPLTARAESEGLAEEMLATLLDGEPWEQEFVARLPDGRQLRVDQSVTPVYEDGMITRFVAIASDVTSRWRRNQQLSVLQRVLRHDLRNNLNEILLSVQMASRETQRNGVQSHLDGIEETIDETLSLSDDIRQFRQTFEDKEAPSKVVDIAAVAQEQAATIRAERPGVEFDIDLDGSAPVLTNDLIEQAVRNVIRNAIQHNDSDTPEVAIELDPRAKDGEVELRVADNGPGVPEEIVAVLNSEQESQLSHLNGFGLWLINWVVTLSGGTLEFEENDPEGTVVQLVLPAAGTEGPLPERTHAS
jgi:PAS domain S-box-containing protein